MRVVRRLADLAGEVAAAEAEALSAFGDGTVFVEPYVERGRHVEVQVFGTTVLGERDCSIQRRHQKVVEEAPAPLLPEDTREALHAAAQQAAEAIDYRGAGTVEFLYDAESEPLLVPGDEHPPPGRAPRHRAGVGRRPGGDAARRCRSCASGRASAS